MEPTFGRFSKVDLLEDHVRVTRPGVGINIETLKLRALDEDQVTETNPKIVAPAAAVDLVRSGATPIDVRSLEEWQAGHLEAALHVPMGGIAEEAPNALPDKNRPLLLYCASGARAEMAGRVLAELGYTKVHVLQPGGISQLQSAGLAVS